MRRRSTILALVSALAFALAACGEPLDTGFPPPTGDATEEPGDEFTGTIDVAAGNVFRPVEVTVEAGTTVRWHQSDNAEPHTVTGATAQLRRQGFDSHPDCSYANRDECMLGGDEYEYTFDEPGTYPYYCILHGTADGIGMYGEIIVT